MNPKNKAANLALLLATTALVVNFWAWTLLSPLGVSYASELALTPVTLSFLLAVPVIVGSLGRVVLGMLTDTYGGKAVFSAVCFLTALPVVGLVFAHDYSQLVFAAFFLGLGGAVFAAGIPFVSAWFAPERRGFVLGIYSMGNAGTALSAFLTPHLSTAIGRSQTYLVVAVLLVIMGCLFLLLGRDSRSRKRQKGSPLQRLAVAARQRITWDLSAVYVITFGAFVAFGMYLPVLLSAAYGLTVTDAASRAAGFVLLATVARPFGGWLSDRIGSKIVIQGGLLAVVGLAAAVAWYPSLHLYATIAYLSLAFVLGCCSGAVFALIGKLVKSELMGSTTGIVGAAGGLGGFLPPLILGVAYQTNHSYAAALLMLSASTLAIFIFISARFRDKTVIEYR